MTHSARHRAGFTKGFTKRVRGCLFRHQKTGGWYWKVRPPGESKVRYIPLVPVGARSATKSKEVAAACAKRLWLAWGAASKPPATLESQVEQFVKVTTAESSARNAESHRRAVLGFIRASGIVQPWEITSGAVQDYLAGLKLAPGTIHRHRAGLSKFFAFCILRGLMDDNPIRKIKGPRIYLPPPRYLTGEQVAVFLAKVRESRHRPLWPATAVCLYAGLRLGEMQALRWGDVQASAIIVGAKDPTKTFSWRTVPIAPELAEALKALPRGDDNGHVFPRWGKRTWVGRLSEITKSLPVFGELAGQRVGNQWHLLRSTFAINCAIAGTDLWSLMQLLGHSNPQTTMRYVNIGRAYAGRAARLGG